MSDFPLESNWEFINFVSLFTSSSAENKSNFQIKSFSARNSKIQFIVGFVCPLKDIYLILRQGKDSFSLCPVT